MTGCRTSVIVRELASVTVLARTIDDSPDEDAFLADAQKYRRELLAHCYG
jgi:RNA polymerase sigma-70 factor (ECF subfamily)